MTEGAFEPHPAPRPRPSAAPLEHILHRRAENIAACGPSILGTSALTLRWSPRRYRDVEVTLGEISFDKIIRGFHIVHGDQYGVSNAGQRSAGEDASGVGFRLRPCRDKETLRISAIRKLLPLCQY